MICCIICILQTPVSCKRICQVVMTFFCDTSSTCGDCWAFFAYAHSSLHGFHVQCWNTFSTTGFSETTQAILIISPYSRKVYNLKIYDGSSICIIYQDMLMCSWLNDLFNWHQDFLIDFPNPTRFIWFSENLLKTPLVLPASYRIARFRLIYERFVGKINEIWFHKRDCFMPCLSKEPPFFSSKLPD